MINSGKTLTMELANYVQDITYDSIPGNVVQRAKEANCTAQEVVEPYLFTLRQIS